MKWQHILVLFILILGVLPLRAQLTDDFSDGDFTSNPEWTGDLADFEVNGDGQLHSIATEAGQSTLSTAVTSTLNNKAWEIWVKQSFAPSSNNFGRIYLSAQVPQFAFSSGNSAGAEGYFLQLGESGSEDAIRLFRDDVLDEAPVEIAAGTPALVAGSFEIRIRVTRDDAGNWNIYADPTGGTAYQFEASGMDATYSSTNAFGLACTYTSSNADNFYFDDVYFGDPITDDIPPEVESLSVISSTELQLIFSEPLDPISAENTGNYSVSGQGNPTSATLNSEQPNEVNLTFASAFEANTTLTLSVTNVEDLWENSMAADEIEFAYVEGADPLAGDVVINELMADPSPPLGLPEHEFVELYNTTAQFFDLSDWVFVNSTTEKVLPSVVLEPNSYLILCDADAIAEFTSFGQVVGIPSFTALANTGDSLTLRDNSGLVLDIVVYTDDWYGDDILDDGGVTLERVNPFSACNGAANWSASAAFSGGSPGEQNTIFNDAPDTTAPVFLSWNNPNPSSINLVFNEPLASDVFDNLTLELTPAIAITSTQLTFSNTTILLELGSALEPGINYTLNIDGVSDCAGNTWSEALDISILLGFQPEEGDILITEILPDPDDELPSPAAEYIEIYNAGTQTLELTQVQLNDGFFTEQVSLEPEGYLIIADVENTLAFLTYSNVAFMEDFPGLTNSGRSLSLTNNGTLLDSLSYDLTWYQDPAKDDGGWALERISLEDPCSDSDNWRASEDASGATPGAVNSVNDPNPDATPPEIRYVLVDNPDELRIVLSEGLDALTGELVEAEVGLLQNGSFSPLDYELQNSVWEPASPRELLLTFDGGFAPPLIYTVRLTGVADCWGNEADFVQGSFAVPEEAQPNDLVINELLSNPTEDGVDFVEIYNRSTRNISLQGWQLAKLDGSIPDQERVITELPLVLLAGEYVFLSTSTATVKTEYPLAIENNGLEMESLPTYSNDEGNVLLLQPDGTIMDQLDYTEEMIYPLLTSSDGVSLERVNPDVPASVVTNWHSAAGTVGYATPGYQNSQYAESPMVSGSLETSPEVFSPDNDGFEDVVQIAYELEAPGFTGTMIIYDQAGRRVRKLVEQEILGVEGVFIWDGINDNRTKAGMGIYIVVLEAFEPTGNVIQLRTTTVLGHPLN